MGSDQSIDIIQIACPVCHGFHDDKVLWGCEGNIRPRNRHHLGPRDSLFLKRETAQGDIHIDARRLMPNEQHPRLASKFQCVPTARDKAKCAAGVQKRFELILRQQDKHIDIASYARAPLQRHCKAADNDPACLLRMPPPHQIT